MRAGAMARDSDLAWLHSSVLKDIWGLAPSLASTHDVAMLLPESESNSIVQSSAP